MKPVKSDPPPADPTRKLAPAYLISGEEPLLVGEAADEVRKAARKQGFETREMLFVEPGFDWQSLAVHGASMSLFAERRILELRLPGGKPGQAGAAALLEYLKKPAQDTVLLVIAGKVDGRAEWVKRFARRGVHRKIDSISPRQLPAWIAGRIRAAGLKCPAGAAALLAERVEGNLLAAAQEVEKLRLWLGDGEITLEQVTHAVADSARFDVFQLCDAALAGEAARAVRIIDGLEAEGAGAPLVVWSLQRALHDVLKVYRCLGRGQDTRRAVAAARIWPADRRELVRVAVERLDQGMALGMLERVADIDRAAKGQGPGACWNMLRELACEIAGVPLLTPRPALKRAG